MLISCPKCQSKYEIPNNLIGKTGQNFRCVTCAHIWHAMRQDALDYTEDDKNEPYIEAIELKAEDKRNFPADNRTPKAPLNVKSGRITRSSEEILAREGIENYTPKIKKQNEIVLTSKNGASFTITPPPTYIDDEDKQQSLKLTINPEDIRIKAEDRLLPETPFKGYRKTKLFLWGLAIAAALLFLRRDIVSLIPTTEGYYNKIGLSGINNPESLKFGKVTAVETIENGTKGLKITAEIKNNSRFSTIVPTIQAGNQNITPARGFLKAAEKTTAEAFIPFSAENPTHNVVLTFARP